jgi:hypothetical protein
MLPSLEVTIHISYLCLRDKDKKDKLGKERREESDEGNIIVFVKINLEIFPFH